MLDYHTLVMQERTQDDASWMNYHESCHVMRTKIFGIAGPLLLQEATMATRNESPTPHPPPSKRKMLPLAQLCAAVQPKSTTNQARM